MTGTTLSSKQKSKKGAFFLLIIMEYSHTNHMQCSNKTLNKSLMEEVPVGTGTHATSRGGAVCHPPPAIQQASLLSGQHQPLQNTSVQSRPAQHKSGNQEALHSAGWRAVDYRTPQPGLNSLLLALCLGLFIRKVSYGR